MVHYAVTTEEDTKHLQKILCLFKDVVNKDFTEWKVLKEEFPDAKLLAYQWHVIKAMFQKMFDCDAEKSERNDVRSLLRQLVYLKAAEEYEDTKENVHS